MVKHIYDKGTHKSKVEMYDVLILGAGPAGMTAALYAARYELKTAVIAKSIGGTANLAHEIENWPGFIGSGLDLMNRFKEQAEKFGAKFLETEIKGIKRDKEGDYVLDISDNREVHGKAIILTLGTEHRKLDIPGEKEFLGRGVSYCATCDGRLFKNKNVAIIGGADSAAKAGLYLSNIAKKVYIIYRRETMRCEPLTFKKLSHRENVDFYYYSNPLKITGDKKVKEIEIEQQLKDKKKKIKLEVDGVFIEIGATPVTKILDELHIQRNERDYIVTGKDASTNIEGVFAAGDNTDNTLKQVITASAEGAIAAKSAFEYLKIHKK
jgi:thioredoxin reductase (NADPH)